MQNSHFGTNFAKSLLQQYKTVYLGGIGGISMEGIAHMLKARGYRVRGCDRLQSGPQFDRFQKAGIAVEPEEQASPVPGELVVYSLALGEESPLIKKAKHLGLPLISRGECLGAMAKDYQNTLCVAGTHGKSTTLGMIAHIMNLWGVCPTVSSGAPLSPGRPPWQIGDTQWFLVEGCEYQNSFLSLSPTLGIITNMEMDHPDFFPNFEKVKEAFSRFGNNSKEVLYRGGIPYEGAGTAFGFSGEEYRCSTAPDCRTVTHLNTPICKIPTKYQGYQVENALAAAAACHKVGIPLHLIEQGLQTFPGVGRRMEFVGKRNGASLYLDYAHHPTQIKKAVEAIPGRVLVLYQPHTYSRTKALWDGFVKAFQSPDLTVLVDIYPARETPLTGVTSKQLATAAGVVYAPTKEEGVAYLKERLQPGDTVLIMGAGDIDQTAPLFFG